MIRLSESKISTEDFNYLTDKIGWGELEILKL